MKKRSADTPAPAPAHIAISSRIRLARNLRGLPFPAAMNTSALEEVCARVKGLECPEAPNFETLKTQDKWQLQRLYESHLISADLLHAPRWAALRRNREGTHSIMVNEEDHLRIQVLLPGLALQEAWKEANALDDTVERQLEYAFSPTLGYLTSCPTNVGTGLRASVMMHLPALMLTGEMEPVLNGLKKIGLTVRGAFGEGSDAQGQLFQISNQITLGQEEGRIIQDMDAIVREVAGHEENARELMKEKRPTLLKDIVERAVAVLRSAWLLSAEEAQMRLANVRLGVAMGLLEGPDIATLDRLLIEVQPGHLQEMMGRELTHEERAEVRATWMRAVMSERLATKKSTRKKK